MTRVLVDMDGVLADFMGGIGRIVRSLGGEPLPPEGYTSFYISELYPDLSADVLSAMRQPGFYYELAPIDGAIQGMRSLMGAGFDVWVCTSPMRSRWCAGEKIAWVKDTFGNLGNEMSKRMVITKDKTLVRGDVLIDDKPEVVGSDVPSWVHLVFDQPYNRDNPGPRLRGWGEPDLVEMVRSAPAWQRERAS